MSDSVIHEPDCHGFDDDQDRGEGICKDWCYGHMRCEPLREGDFRLCGECFHVYRTGDELVQLYSALLIDGEDVPAADAIGICPVWRARLLTSPCVPAVPSVHGERTRRT